MKLQINKIFSSLLVLVGSFLEIYFYFYRFSQDGIDPVICLVIAASLSLLLCMATYNMRSSKKWLVLFIPLLCYSVFSTSAGQTFVLINKENVTVNETIIKSNESKSTQTQKEIDRLNAEADGLVAASAAYNTPELQAKYRTTIQKNRERLDAIDTLLNKKSSTKESTDTSKSETQKQSIKATSIYEFYGNMRTWTVTEFIKFLFHTILSIFIAIMAPVGIATWNNKKKIVVDSVETVSDTTVDPVTPTADPSPRITITPADVDRYVKWTWYRSDRKTDTHILPKIIVLEHMAKTDTVMDESVYDAIHEEAHLSGIINDDDVIRVTDKTIAANMLKEILCK